MSQSAITTAFEGYLTQQVASGGAVTLDQFIFANVPDLDPDVPIDRSEQIPVDYIVYQQAVTLPGVINNNEVVYSVTMGAEVGDFDFNWIGLVNSATSLLGMVTHAPVQQKFKNADGQQGNTLTRSFLMEYDGAATATSITTPAETWQIDFTARLAGMDDRQRLENMDIYGYGAFFGDGYLVWGNPTDGYTIDAGVGYVDGLRVQLNADQSLNVTAKPISVYVDACWKGTLTSVWNVQQQITLASDLSNYTDADGTAHYVFAVASIDANGAVTDLRPSGSKDNQALSGYLQTKNNLAEIADAGAEAQAEARANTGCGTAATGTLTTSTTDSTLWRVLTVGDHGVGNAAILAVDTALSSPAGYPSGFFLQNGSPDNNRYGSYGAGVHLLYTTNPEAGAYSGNLFVRADGHVIGEWLQINADGTISAQRVNELYGTLNKPTAEDVSALALSTATFSIGTDFNDAPSGSTSFVYNEALNAPPANCAVIDWWGLSPKSAEYTGYRGQIAADYANGRLYFRTFNGDNNTSTPWDLLYSGRNPPGPLDTGAMPLYPSPLTVDLNTLGASSSVGVYSQQMDVYATPELHYPTQQSGTLLVTPSAYGCQQEYTTFNSGQKFTRGLSGNFDGSGPWLPWVPQYSPGNPPPSVSSIRMANYGINGSEGVYDSSQRILTGIYATNGWDNPSTQESRQMQYEINGSFYNVAWV
ncbi:phage tail-collar fiber domain-containing protein [Citrobacter sp. FP75]|uniref:phage tail-collar fiber domain-containing protein n=1 Tax=Citrobacter sp. FP75 TaxID=1852949 RepID=UPI001FD35CDC|nr:phage tail protein [Citrobacter sp. FP75]